jgi:hypothetical protein
MTPDYRSAMLTAFYVLFWGAMFLALVSLL